MAHHIRAQDIDMSVRRPFIVAYLGQLRRALNDPSLPAPVRERLQGRMARLRAELAEHRERDEAE